MTRGKSDTFDDMIRKAMEKAHQEQLSKVARAVLKAFAGAVKQINEHPDMPASLPDSQTDAGAAFWSGLFTGFLKSKMNTPIMKDMLPVRITEAIEQETVAAFAKNVIDIAAKGASAK